MQRKHGLALGLAGLAIALFVSLSQAQVPPPGSDPCVAHWAETGTREQRAVCVATAQAINDQRETADIATALARSPRPITSRPTVIPGEPIRLTTDTLSAETRRIEPITTGLSDGPLTLRSSYAASVWHVGGIITPDGLIGYRFYAYSVREQCKLGTYVDPDPVGDYADFERNNIRTWHCPQNIGKLIITGATGPTGIVMLTDTLSRTITFNLATEAWTRNGEPWLPAVNSTPAPMPTPMP